jgi:hypothetical protein
MFRSLLSPIGQYRATNTTPSKGKRSKKRKRKETKTEEEGPALSKPPPPEISSFVVVGLNSITRSLESLSQKSKALRSVDCEKNSAGHNPQLPLSAIENKRSNPGQVSMHEASVSEYESLHIIDRSLDDAGEVIQTHASGEEKKALSNPNNASQDVAMSMQSSNSLEKSKRGESGRASSAPEVRDRAAKGSKEQAIEDEHHHFSAIFVPRSSQPPILHAHLPQLVVIASLANPELPVTKLVQLPKGCDTRLSEALGLPRVSFIGILDGAPHSKSLVDLVRECVPEIKIPWLEEVKKSVYLPVKINAIETFVPAAKKEHQVA